MAGECLSSSLDVGDGHLIHLGMVSASHAHNYGSLDWGTTLWFWIFTAIFHVCLAAVSPAYWRYSRDFSQGRRTHADFDRAEPPH